MSAPDEELLQRYLEELSWLRSMGSRFAARHPDVASQLELSGNVCPDPHVERLIESFAFLTARIQSDLASDFPEIAAELLQTLYPHYLNPIPSMTIVRFEADAKPARIARHTKLFADTTAGDVCRFRTCYAVDVWPVRVTHAAIEDGADFEFPDAKNRAVSVLRLRLECDAAPFEELAIDTLRFFLANERIVDRLYPLLLAEDRRRVTVVARGADEIPTAAYLEVAQVGFGEDEDMIPWPHLSHPAYRLLQEYFTFERKFHFFDVKGLRGRLHGREADLLFLLDGEPPHAGLHRDDLLLGCTPAINLFTRTSEPIRVDHRTIEYPLVADHRHQASTAIHSIRLVSGSSNAAETSRAYAPFYSYTHDMTRGAQSAFWHARRDGEGVRLSFRDTSFDPALPGDEVVYAHLFCTNGDLAAELPARSRLYADEDLDAGAITALLKPTPQLEPAHGGELLWRLVSHLSLNHLSLDDTDAALRALREILLLYCPEGATTQRERIQQIRGVASRKVTGRAKEWRGFARGTEISLELDRALLEKDNGFLFASVLSHFFGLHASINSFSRLVVRGAGDTKGMQWPIMTGAKAVL